VHKKASRQSRKIFSRTLENLPDFFPPVRRRVQNLPENTGLAEIFSASLLLYF